MALRGHRVSYTYLDGAVTVVADIATVVPGHPTGETFFSFSSPSRHAESVAFYGRASINEPGIYLFQNTVLSVVADTTTQPPGSSPRQARSSARSTNGRPYGAGKAAFIGTGTDFRGVYFGDDKQIEVVAELGTPLRAVNQGKHSTLFKESLCRAIPLRFGPPEIWELAASTSDKATALSTRCEQLNTASRWSAGYDLRDFWRMGRHLGRWSSLSRVARDPPVLRPRRRFSSRRSRSSCARWITRRDLRDPRQSCPRQDPCAQTSRVERLASMAKAAWGL